tara:strand:- start:13001 stop:13225 length:225 start_codon:yes stop_codon:yes gene_type:complete
MSQVMEAQVVNLQKVTRSGKSCANGFTVIRKYFFFCLRLALNDIPSKTRQEDPGVCLLPWVFHTPNQNTPILFI